VKKVGLALSLLLSCTLVVGAVACQGPTGGTDESTSSSVPVSATSPAVATTVTPTAPPTHWTKVSLVSEPSPRTGHAMVYDPGTGKVVLFGGRGAGAQSPLNDLWVYDPDTRSWEERAPAGPVPSARWGHTMVYDPGDGGVYLFGGYRGFKDEANDLWKYDAAANVWTELHPSGDLPPGSYEHTMVYDAGTQNLLLFGGLRYEGNQAVALDDLWSYDAGTNMWTQLHPTGTGPQGNNSAPMVYDPGTGKVILFGGYGLADGSYPSDLWAYDPGAQSWEKVATSGAAPPGGFGQTLVYHPGSSSIVVFGGGRPVHDGVKYSDGLWAYDPSAKSWTELSPADQYPHSRSGQAMVYEGNTGSIVMFGGGSQEDGDLTGTWMLTP
jgi:N-acetylneuraminic acid mutarotase